MFILLCINLYSSRVVLQELGAEDFGIYNVVGGFVSMFLFLNTTMSSATSRFITFELAKGNYGRLVATFKASLTLHAIIAVLIVLISETLGLWFINSKLNIPPESMHAANIVYQLSILTIVIKTIQVPFNAAIIAHERMGVYAIIEICNALITLAFLFILQIIYSNKLIVYAIMILVVAMSVLFAYVTYCKMKFIECKIGILTERSTLKPMLMFSAFDLYGNMSVSVRNQGINIILNIFFGTIINAANGIATQVQSAILMMSNNVTLAFRPQIIKNYASDKLHLMESQVNYASIFSMMLFSILAIPLILEMPYVLNLWLGNPPPYTVNITRIAIITCWVGALNSILTIPIHATGNIKIFSICGGTIYLLTLPFAYILLKYIKTPEVAYFTMLTFMAFLLTSTSIILKRKIPSFSFYNYFVKSICPCCISIILSAILTYMVKQSLCENFFRLLIVIMIYATSTVLIYLSVIGSKQRAIIKSFIVNLKKR